VRLAAADDLGALVSRHRAKAPIAPAVAAIVLLFVLPAIGVRPVLSLGLVAVLGVIALGTLAARWKPTVEIWDQGLVVRRRWTHARTIRFDDVDAVFYEPLQLPLFPSSAAVTLTTHTGGRVVLPSGLARSREIAVALHRRVTRALLAPAMRAFAAGETLHFGPVTLHDDALVVTGCDDLSLDDLDCVEARPTEIRFYARGKNSPPHASVPLLAVPHPFVLLAILATRVPVENTTGLPT
jgi:hypothetical protein